MNTVTALFPVFQKNLITRLLKQLLFVVLFTFSAGCLYSQTAWYSYQSGNWNNTDWRTWTTDPSGTTLINPSHAFPGASDPVVILNGRVVTIPTGTTGITVTSVTIQEGAVLDITNTTGHSFGTNLNGSGLLRLSASSFPGFAAGTFVQPGGGTVEYYGLSGGFTLSQFTYNNLILNLAAVTDEAFYDNATDLNINGNLTISSGTLRIGRSTTGGNVRNVRILGDVSVSASGQILVGAQGYRHQIYMSGDFINNGTVRFTTLGAPNYTSNPAANVGLSDVIFNNAIKDQHIVCNGTTVFYRIEIVKGTDQTFVLHIDADATNRFYLYGRNDLQDYNWTNSPTIPNDNALGLEAGTVRLGSNIVIPSLATWTGIRNCFTIDGDAALWLDGANVTFTATPAGSQAGFRFYGTLRVSSNSILDMVDVGTAMRLRETGKILIEGGTVTTPHLTNATIPGTHRGGFFMTGGTLTVTGENTPAEHACLSLPHSTSSFTMTGGTINILLPNQTGGAANRFSLLLGIDKKNSIVTGGTINITLPTGGDVYVNSTVPLPNLNITKASASASACRIQNYGGYAGSPSVPAVAAQPLDIVGDLSVRNYARLNSNTTGGVTNNVLVGRNFIVEANAFYVPNANTTIFYGDGTQLFGIYGAITGNLNNLTLTNASELTIDNSSVINPVTVNGNLVIDHGCVINDNGRTILLNGNLTNSGTHFKPVSGPGSIQLTGAGTQTIGGDGTGSLNNITLNKSAGAVNLSADMTVTGELRLANTAARLNIGAYNLFLDTNADVYDNLTGTGKVFGATRMILTNGLVSDGGVSKKYTGTSAYVFPFGFYNTANSTYYYMPASVQFGSAPSAYGTVTSRPVKTRHPLAQSTNSLSCFWKTESSGFSGVPANSVIHRYYYDYARSNYFVAGTETNYIPGVYRESSGWTSIADINRVNDGTNELVYDTAYTADGEYTAGEPATFSSIAVRYSTGVNGDWDNTATWSATAVGGPGGASVPNASTIVIIGDATHNHTVTINSNGKLTGSLTIFNGSTLDIRNTNNHNFQALPSKGVSGTGTMRIATNNYFPGGDFGDFIGESGGTVEYYTLGGNSISIPVTSAITGLVLDHYYNLKASPAAGTSVTFPNSNLTIYNDLTTSDAGSVYTNTTAAHSITVNRDFTVTAGTFQVMNTNIQSIHVNRNLAVDGTFRVQNTAPAVNHTLQLYGNLTGSGTFTVNYANGRILTYFKGAENAVISGNTKNFYSIELDKGNSQTPLLDVTANLTTAFDPALTITNGTFRYNVASGTLNASTAAGFVIPVTGCLSVLQGTVNVVTAANNNDLIIYGKLEILGGTMNIGTLANNNNNDIEYASVGKPEIDVLGGVLNVNGQIRRNIYVVDGSLTYLQSGGAVNIYGRNYTASTEQTERAKFEICNDSSSFTMTNGTINIYRGGGTSFGDVYLRPYNSSVTGGTLILGPAAGIGNQIYNLDATCNIHNLSVASVAGNTATARIMVNPLVLSGDLSISSNGGVLNCNNKNVSVAGNFTNNGTYTPGTNITSFYGGNTQIATFGVATTFNKLIINKTSGTAVSFTGSVDPVISDSLSILEGTLTNTGARNIVAFGNIINNSIHTSAGTGALLVQGTKNQVVSGNDQGQFGNLTIANGAANGITLTANATINGVLTMTTGYVYINDYLLTLSASSSIGGTPGVPASCNWIITNGVLSDKGVTRVFPASSPSSFTFPIGVMGKYTPVIYTLNYTGAPGTITVKPVNNRIPSLTDATINELQYYWNVSSTPFGGLTSVNHSYKYLVSDIQGATETNATFVGARYYTDLWTNLGHGVINTVNHSIDINAATYIDGEYTCGEAVNFLTKPVYYSYDLAPGITTTGANWNSAGSWATGGHNGTPATLPPDGNPVVIKAGHRINVNNDDRTSYSLQHNGILDLRSTVGHSFGHVSGAGRIIMNNTTAGQFVFPGGDYTSFMNTTGSTIEYYGGTGPMSSSISPIIKVYQNLEFTGPISKNMSAVNITVKGNMLIRESQLNNSIYNKNIILQRNWVDEVPNGFIPGRGLVSFEGSALQTITTPNPEHFYNFRINNAAGVTLDGTAEVANRLYLVNGRINTSTADLLTLTNLASNVAVGGSDASFVDGPLSKRILLGQSFVFPVGNYNGAATKPARYGGMRISGVSATNYWVAQYVNADPDVSYSRSSLLSPITTVSDNEYWIITRPGANTANIRLRWDDQSGIASVGSTRVTEWVTPANRWEEKGSLVSGTIDAGTVATTTPVATGSYVFTLGVSGVTARITNVSPASICNNGEVATVTVTLTGTAPWTLTYQAGSNTFTQSGIGSDTYNIQLTGADLGGPGMRNIRLTSVSDITGTGMVDDTEYPVDVKDTYIPDIQGTFTVGAGEVRSFMTANHVGSSYAWTWQGADGGAITPPDAASTSITINTPGSFPTTYQLQIIETSPNGCVAQDVQAITVVNAPSPDISPDDANQCLSNVVTYSTPEITGHTYAWTVVGGTPATGTGHSITVTWNTVGNGSVTVVEDNSGVTGTDVVNVIIDPQPNTGLVVTGPASVCYDDVAIITVAGSQSGFSYQLREGSIPIGAAVAGTGGNIGLSSLPLTLPVTFNVLAYNNGCSEQLTQTVTVNVTDPAAPTGNASQSFCAITNPTVANLFVAGTGILWYTASIGGTPLPTTTVLTDGTTYYASQTVSGCESTSRFAVTVTVGNPAAPTGNATQNFCAVDNPTVANLAATGTAIKWYTSATGGTALATTTALVTGTYYASQTVSGCESTSRFAVTVTVGNPAAPTGNATQNFCAIDNPTVANLTATGAAIKWYTSATGGTALATTTALATGTYYASQTVSGCESTSRFAVTVTVGNPAAPTGNATQNFCAVDNPTVANLVATGTAIKWYTSSTGGIALATTTTLATGTYYASQTVSGCESALRLAVAVTVGNPAAPTGNATQNFCAINNPTVASLAATGTAIKWYTTATGGTALATTTALAAGTYYASQTVSGCESALRLAVTVTISNPAAPTGNATQSFCAIDNPTVANLTATGTGIKWYANATGGTALVTTTALASGTYYASQTVSGCESTGRFAVTVTVGNPAAPTGNAIQNFCLVDNPTVANLVATGTAIKWYTSSTGGTALVTTTALATGTYYASQTVSGCESALRLAVAVTVVNPAAPAGSTTQNFCAINNPTVASLAATGTGIKWYTSATGGTALSTTTALATGTYYASQTVSGCESVTRLAVSVTIGNTPVTSTISGDPNPLCGSTGVHYSVVLTPGSSYMWTVPADAVITSGNAGPDNNEIVVNFGEESGTITVTETSALNCQGDPVTLGILLQGCELVADFMASKTNLCLGEEVTFTDLSHGVSAGVTYLWDFGDGADPPAATLSGPHVVNYNTPGLKTVQLIVIDLFTDTLTLSDYITVNPAPEALLETGEICGAGTLEILASLNNADAVEFSLDGGLTIAGTDNTGPYSYGLALEESETKQVWGRAYNSSSGCYGTWENYVFAISHPVPVTEKIATSHITVSVPGYVDVVCSGQQDVFYYVNGEAGAIYNWRMPELGISKDSTDGVSVNWDVPEGEYTIELQKVSAAGCVGNTRDTLVLVSRPQPDLGEDVTLCGGNTHTFSLTEDFANYEWSDFSSGPTLTVTTSGTVTVKVWDEYGCSGSDTAALLISSIPVVDLGPDTVLCGDSPLQLDAGDFAGYLWSTGATTNPITVREGAGTVSVTVTNEDGCEGTDEIIIRPCDPETLLGVIPNTFTPNKDTYHDTWEIKGIYLFPEANVKIFDRWGRNVYEMSGYDNSWDGTDSNGNDLPVGTYYYIIDLNVQDSDPISGNVTIIR